MEINQIPQADLLDILFEGRNKSYGAYDLRKTYDQRLRKALVLTGLLCLLLIGSYIAAGKWHETRSIVIPIGDPIVLSEPPQKEKPATIIKPRVPQFQPQKMAMIRDVTTRIVKDANVRPGDVPPTNAQTDDVKIGLVNQQGKPDDDAPAARTGGDGKGIVDAPKQKEDVDDAFRPVEIESAYIGGPAAWTRFLKKTLNFPEVAFDNKIQGTVIVQFVVDAEGRISDIEAISGPETLRAEAIRAIRLSKDKWAPAIQNGRKVRSYKKQPIIFTMQND